MTDHDKLMVPLIGSPNHKGPVTAGDVVRMLYELGVQYRDEARELWRSQPRPNEELRVASVCGFGDGRWFERKASDMNDDQHHSGVLTGIESSKPEDTLTASGVVSETIHRAVVNGKQAWVRVSAEPHLRSVEVVKNDSGGGWSVSVAAMKFVRPQHTTYRELRQGIEDAIKSVPGVTEVEREIDEVWWASGSASGEELARAVAHVLDHYADRLRDHYNNLNARI